MPLHFAFFVIDKLFINCSFVTFVLVTLLRPDQSLDKVIKFHKKKSCILLSIVKVFVNAVKQTNSIAKLEKMELIKTNVEIFSKCFFLITYISYIYYILHR